MIKLLAVVLLALSLAGCSDAADVQTQRSHDSSALESIDSSAIINDSTRLPTDSTSTTVTH